MHRVRPTVLVVDDDHDTRVEFATWLSDAGFRCITAGDTPTALWFARRLSPDAVVVDLGRRHERLRLARSLGDKHSTVSVIVTSPSNARPLPALPDGVCCHVTKPAASAELVAAVQRATRIRQEAEASSREHQRTVAVAVANRQQLLGEIIAAAPTAEGAFDALRATFPRVMPALFSHARRVAQTADQLANALFMSGPLARVMHGAALLHDIGKLTLPESVLLGEDVAGDAEMDALGNHHARTLALIASAPALAPVGRVVEFVHARWDGAGIPWGLAGEDIPIAARVIALADALDAARNGAPLGLLAPEARYGVLTRGAGTRLDPELVRVYLHAVESPALAATLHSSRHDGAPCS